MSSNTCDPSFEKTWAWPARHNNPLEPEISPPESLDDARPTKDRVLLSAIVVPDSKTVTFTESLENHFKNQRMEELEQENICLRVQNEILQENLQQIQKKNLSPILQRIFYDGSTAIRVKSSKRPVFKVCFEDNLYVAYWRGINMGYAPFRDGLLEEFNQTVIFLWREYAKDDTSTMTTAALRLKHRMLEYFEEI